MDKSFSVLAQRLRSERGYREKRTAFNLLSLTKNLYAQNFGRDIVFSADLCHNGTNGKPPSEREVARRSRDGRSLRDFRVVVSFLLRTLPQSASLTAPSRREP